MPRDLTEGTFSGAGLSIMGAVFMATLFVLELSSFLSVTHETAVLVDESTDEMLQINFNVTLPRLPCAFATVDVQDLMGVHRENLTTNIRKFAVDADLRRIREVQAKIVAPQYQEVPEEEQAVLDGPHTATELSMDAFNTFLKGYEVVMINYYAPWCFWSRKLAPIWDKTAETLGSKPWGRRVAIGKVDCTREDAHKLCHEAHINAFPTVLVYRDGKSHTHEMYQGHRSVDAFVEFARSLVGGDEVTARKLADQPLDETAPPDKVRALKAEQQEQPAVARAERTGPEGCNVAGFIMVNKVPGNFHVHAHNPGYSMETSRLNTSHVVHHLSFGTPLTPQQLRRLPPEADPHSDRFAGKTFASDRPGTVFEHYVKVVSNLFDSGGEERLTTFKYTANSHHYDSEEKVRRVAARDRPISACPRRPDPRTPPPAAAQMPMIYFKYDLSPMSVVTSERRQPLYHFLTNICAIIGGVFTVLGLIDSVVYHGISSLKYKSQLGKAS